jgi:tetratricopeptide (TPR) repeat protein
MLTGDPVSLNTLLVSFAPSSSPDIVALYDEGDFCEVERRCQSALRQCPEDCSLLNLLGYTRYQLGDVREATALLRSSLAIKHAQSGVLNNYGVALRDAERPAEALIRFNEALALDSCAFFQYNKSLVEAELKAHAAFKHALNSDPALVRFEMRPPCYIFSYHKAGTILFSNIIKRLSTLLPIVTAVRGQLINRLFRKKHIVLFYHSEFANRVDIEFPFRAVRIVRDPRDIWVSGYLYHRLCQEEWCTHSQFNITGPIGFPQVDHSMIHRSESWKQKFLARLDRKSYQRNLLDRNLEDGLQFELEGYTGNTLDTMCRWPLKGFSEVLQIKLEDIVCGFDNSMQTIFHHFGFSEGESRAVLGVIRAEDINRMTDAEIAANTHIRSRNISKWRQFLTVRQVSAFERLYGDLVVDLGYDLSR